MTSSLTSKTIDHWHLGVKGGLCCLSDIADMPENARPLLRWWYQQQTRLLIEEADTIRNGVLQDVFALRRRLELLCQEGLGPGDCEPCLEDVERIYAALQGLSDRISSPYLEDSLPLAMQHFLQPWRSRLPLQVKLHNPWEPEPVELVALLLAFLNQVLQKVASGEEIPECCGIYLQKSDAGKALVLQLAYPAALPPALVALDQSADMSPLLQTFHLLGEGSSQLAVSPQALTWELRW